MKGLMYLLIFINPVKPNVSFPYPMKTLESQRFSDVFRLYRNETFDQNGLRNIRYLHVTQKYSLKGNVAS